MDCGIWAAAAFHTHYDAVNRTRILVAVLVMVVLLQLFPERAALVKLLAVSAGTLYCAVWGALRYRAHWRRKSADAARLEADEAEYREYKRELDELRARFDPHRDLADLTAISSDYRDALSALHERYQAMLARKFGPR